MSHKNRTKPKIALSILLIIIFAITSFAYESAFFISADKASYEIIANIRNPFLTVLAKSLDFIGGVRGVIMILAALIGINSTRLSFGVPLSLCAALTSGFNSVLKGFFMRERPGVEALIQERGFSFPSGHSMTAMAICAMAALILFEFSEKDKAFPVKKALALFLIFYGFIMGLSRVYLGVHYMSDVLAGLSLGGALGILCFMAFRKHYFSSATQKLNIPDE